MRIFGLILAGGAGRRMGGADKALLPLAGRPLIAHVIDRLDPQVAALALSGGPSLARWGYPVLPDAQTDRLGPLAGVVQGLRWAADAGADALVTAAVDTPFLPGDLVPCLRMAAEDAAGSAIAATRSGPHPTFALWPVAAAPRLAALLSGGERRLRVAADGAGVALFPDEAAFFNINTPADLALAQALIDAA